MGSSVEASAQSGVVRHLQEGSREPYYGDEGETRDGSGERNSLGATGDKEERSRCLNEHRRADDVGRQARVSPE